VLSCIIVGNDVGASPGLLWQQLEPPSAQQLDRPFAQQLGTLPVRLVNGDAANDETGECWPGMVALAFMGIAAGGAA
tara:strand:- start:191 stop:421 length:231 start_codon:yes stop_codon:yes gene_type:complete